MAASYPEADGAAVYVEGDATLRISVTGEVTYRTANAGGADAGFAGSVETAYSLASGCAAMCGGTVFLKSAEYDGGEYVFCFDYELNGLPVQQADGECAAELRVSGGSVTWARVRFCTYESTGETAELLPALLEAAVIQAGGGGGMALAYADDGQSCDPGWRIS